MQNQDPTANTDPNEYINQLVNVNSLEQLISINQNLSTALGGTGTSSTSSSAAATGTNAISPTSAANGASSGAAAHKGKVVAGIEQFAGGANPASPVASMSAANKRIAGNLSIPPAAPGSERVAQSLNGQHAARQLSRQ
jgi:flagellar basal-body rod modification protein FlgD